MSNSSETPRELADEVLKNELKASEKVQQLFTEHDMEEGANALIQSFKSMCERIEDPDRLRRAVVLMRNFAAQFGSERMNQAAMEVAAESDYLEIEDTHGGQQ